MGLAGEIPPALAKFTGLVAVDVSKNELTGSLPPEVGNLTHLVTLRVDSNKLTGSFPPSIGKLKHLQSLSAAGSGLNGTLPVEILAVCFRPLTSCSFVDNTLPSHVKRDLGVIRFPEDLSALDSMTSIAIPRFSGNSGGMCPSEFPYAFGGQLTQFAGTNRFAGNYNVCCKNKPHNINGFCGGSGSPQSDGKWKLHYSSPNMGNMGTSCTNPPCRDYVPTRRLDENRIKRERVPPQFGALTNLISLKLEANSFGGAIPSQFGKLTNLKHLSLASVGFTGPFIFSSLCV